MYKCYFKKHVRKAFYREVPKAGAISFLRKNPDFGVVEYNNKQLTLEELENAENIGSVDRVESDSEYTSGRSVSEDSYSELFDLTGDNSE